MMINMLEVNETNNMIDHEKLDVRTITMGISLLDCCGSTVDEINEKIYRKITSYAKDLVSTGDAIGREFGVPIVNTWLSFTINGFRNRIDTCLCLLIVTLFSGVNRKR